MTKKLNPIEELSETLDNSKDAINTNLGEQLKKFKLDSKASKKITAQKEKIDEAKVIIKELDLTDDFATSSETLTRFLSVLFEGHHLIRQMGYIKNKRTTLELVTQAYHVLASKEEQYEKNLDHFNEEMEEMGLN
jgi:hypothetical protein